MKSRLSEVALDRCKYLECLSPCIGSKSHHVKLIDASKHFMLAQVKALRWLKMVRSFPAQNVRLVLLSDVASGLAHVPHVDNLTKVES